MLQAAPDTPLVSPHGVTLAHLAIIQAQGADAGSFLQGQLTQDALSMNSTEARAGGYCSAKGRLLANFVMLRPDPQTWWLITDAGLVEPMTKRLKMFVLRAKCAVTARTDLCVRGLQHLEPKAGPMWHVQWNPGQDEASSNGCSLAWWGSRVIEIAPMTAPEPPIGQADASAALQAWRYADVVAGWPWIEAATVEQFVPQMVNFELLGGVNFRKGCYPGQEVVARSQYRGTLKRRMGLFSVEGVSVAPVAGTDLFHSHDPGQPAGLVVNAVLDPAQASRVQLLAEVKLAALGEGTLHLGGADGPVLSPRTLPYRIPTESEM
jgi:folate-binding protein YgfZ